MATGYVRPGSWNGCYMTIHTTAAIIHVQWWRLYMCQDGKTVRIGAHASCTELAPPVPLNAQAASHTDENVVTSCCSSLGRGAAACGASGAAAETCHTAGR